MKEIRTTDTRYHNNFAYYEGDFIGESLHYYGEYQGLEIEFLRSLVEGEYQRNAVVWDIGANIGVHATQLAGVAKHVYSFEPHPMMFDLLERNTSGLDNVSIFNMAAGNSTDDVMMLDIDQISEKKNFGTVRIADQGTVPVKQIILDDFDLPTPDLVKIDVEGYEINVLRGMERTIDEHTPHLNIEAMENNHEIIKFFEGKPYNLFWLCIRNYNENNYKQNRQNFYGNPNGAIFNIFATTGIVPGAQPVKGPDDNWEKLLERIKSL